MSNENPVDGIAAPTAAAPAAQPRVISSEDELKAAFETAQSTGKTILLDFVSENCEACDEDKKEHLPKLAACDTVEVLTVDVDKLPEIADALRADETPTLYMGKGEDFLRDLQVGDAARTAEKRIPKPKYVKEVNPGPGLMRKIKCARK